jgi:transposase
MWDNEVVSDIPAIPGPDGTAEQFLTVITTLIDQINHQNEIIQQLQATITELNARLGMDSSNSSKPPSTDGFKPAPKSLRQRSGRKPGGQAGHKGTTLQMTETPDQRIDHRADLCPECGTNLSGQPDTRIERRQVVDLPPIKATIVEHRFHHVTCPGCGHDIVPDLPGVTRQIQYGSNVNAFMAYLVNAQYLSESRCAQAMTELMGVDCSTPTVHHATSKASARLVGFTDWVKQHLSQAPVLHVDETSIKINGRNHWAHSASTPDATLIDVHPKRGRVADDDIGIIGSFHGILVHDAWKVYDTYPNVAGHQLCCQHALRELKAVTDYYHTNQPGQWCWADQVAHGIRLAIHDPATISRARAIIIDGLDPASTHHPPGKLGNKHRALAKRINERLDDYLRFATTDKEAYS